LGPRPDPNGTFSWANGSRLYYANLAASFSTARGERAFKGVGAIAVSRTDDIANALGFEFVGDYNHVVATNDFAAAVWNDVRDAALRPAIDACRQSLLDGSPIPGRLPRPTARRRLATPTFSEA
jgi:hypothetical protein